MSRIRKNPSSGAEPTNRGKAWPCAKPCFSSQLLIISSHDFARASILSGQVKVLNAALQKPLTDKTPEETIAALNRATAAENEDVDQLLAWFRRRPSPGLIFHSDRGSQYASGDFQHLLKAFGMRGSMSRIRVTAGTTP
jgi:hypothetical protein